MNTRSGGSAGDGHSLDAADGDPTDAVFVDNEGKVGIGTIGPAFKLDVQGTNVTSRIADGFVQIRTKIDSTNGIARTGTFSSHPFRITTNDLDWFTIDVNGNVGIGTTNPGNILTIQQNSLTDPIADAWTTYSSRRWKTNIMPIENALEKVRRLRGVSYDWKASGKHDIGLIAEEVGEVVPDVVAYEENGQDAKSVDYARLVALLIEGMKEQQKEIETLKAKTTQLESALKKLEGVTAAQGKPGAKTGE